MNERTKQAMITLIIGLVFNIALGAAKLVAGILSDSTAVSSDALNNLSDAAVSVVTIIATALSARAADREHPYGHGRYEYISTFILGAVIVAVGVEVLRGGIERAAHPETVNFGAAVWATLGVAIGVKSFMTAFYALRGKKMKSDTIRAAALDSASDAAVTTVVLVCALIEKFTGVHFDGYVSIAVAIVILVFAVRILKSTVDRLLGNRPDPELVNSVNAVLSESKSVISSHDLIINDYGASNKIAEVDAVFSHDMSFVDVHAECDAIERAVLEKTGVRLCVHADPDSCTERETALFSRVSGAVENLGATVHDITVDDENKLVRMDVLVTGDAPESEIKQMIGAAVRQSLSYDTEIHTDYI